MKELIWVLLLDPFVGSFDGSNERSVLGSSRSTLKEISDGILEESALGVPLVYFDGEALCSDKGIIIGSIDGEVLGSTLGK